MKGNPTSQSMDVHIYLSFPYSEEKKTAAKPVAKPAAKSQTLKVIK